MLLDCEKDRQLYWGLKGSYGDGRADHIATRVFSGDFAAQNWEVTLDSWPFRFSYQIIDVNGSKSLVHESDEYSLEDILWGVDQRLRGGLEYAQISLVRQRLLEAQEGSSFIWISPKRTIYESVYECPYPATQINIAQKIDQHHVLVSQFQSRLLNLGLSACVLNKLSEETLVGPEPRLSELMLAVGERKDCIEDEEVQYLIARLTGKEREFNRSSSNDSGVEVSAKSYLQVIKEGVSPDALVRKRLELLLNTVDYNTFKRIYPDGGSVFTSCGRIESGSGNIPSWCERCGYGREDLRCKSCKKEFKIHEVNSHRCVC